MSSSTSIYPANVHLRVFFLMLMMMAALALVEWRLWEVQIVRGPEYAAKIAANREIRVRIPPVRGEIRDRNGLLLVGNRSRHDVEFYLPEMVRGYRERIDGDVPTVRYVGRVRGMARTLREPDIVQITHETVLPRLEQLGLPADEDEAEIARHFRINAEVPYTFLENVDFPTLAKFSEHDLGVPGVRIVTKPMREYPFGAMASHILGYVGDPEELSQLPDADAFDFYEPNVVGKAQMELFMDQYLRGTAGVRVMERTAKGVIGKELRVEPPHPGNTVYLTINARIQFIAEQALRAVGRAGAVVVDPNNGEILAMASVPSFDPNTFVPSIRVEEWKRLTKDETNPLVNRAINAFPPGSTFKVVTSLAGLRKGLARASFFCGGGVTYGDHYFKCWRTSGHGSLSLADAVKVSCNAFFYQYGNAAGIDSIDIVGTMLGLGQAADIGLTGEQTGVLPGPEWLKVNYPQERWSSAYTANVSIGQGYDLVSPLQLVMAYSAVANGGTSYYPRLVRAVADSQGKLVRDEDGQPVISSRPRVRANLCDSGISPADIQLLRTGFWKVVNEDGGTARRARLPGGIVAGKTGTAQAMRDGHQDTIAWFVCFAPFDKPKYAVCVMVQGGAHGGSVAAPIAAKIMEETLAMDRGDYAPALVALAPARNSDPFRMIESVEVESAVPRQSIVSDDEPAGPIAAGGSQRGGRQEFAAPRLKKQAAVAARDASAPGNAQPAPVRPPPPRKNLFQWLFGPRGGR
jgi:penicillin-binding protein 2